MLTVLLAETAHAADAEHGGGGFPPFETWHWQSQAFWLILSFLVLLVVLSRMILPRIKDTLERRSDTIVGALDEAHRLNEGAGEAEKALERRLAEARARARTTAAEAQDTVRAQIARETEKVDAQIEARLSEAESRIAQMRERAMDEVEGIAVSAAHALVGHLGGKTDEAAVRKAVADTMVRS